MAVSLFASGYGIYRAIFISGCKDDAQRGGAIGTVVALLFLVMARSYGTKLYKAVYQEWPDLVARIQAEDALAVGASLPPEPPITPEVLRARIKGLVGAIVIDGKYQKTQNWIAMLATAVGTVVWGFGDLFAIRFIVPPLF